MCLPLWRRYGESIDQVTTLRARNQISGLKLELKSVTRNLDETIKCIFGFTAGLTEFIVILNMREDFH